MSDLSEILDKAIETGEPIYTADGSEIYLLGNQDAEAAVLGLKPMGEVYKYYGLVKTPNEDTTWGWWENGGKSSSYAVPDIEPPKLSVDINLLMSFLSPHTTYVAWYNGLWWSTTREDKPREINYRTYTNLSQSLAPNHLPDELDVYELVIDVRDYVNGKLIATTEVDSPTQLDDLEEPVEVDGIPKVHYSELVEFLPNLPKLARYLALGWTPTKGYKLSPYSEKPTYGDSEKHWFTYSTDVIYYHAMDYFTVYHDVHGKVTPDCALEKYFALLARFGKSKSAAESLIEIIPEDQPF